MSAGDPFPVGSEDLRHICPTSPIAILDLSSFRRECVAASLARYTTYKIETSDSAANLPLESVPALVILFYESDELGVEQFRSILEDARLRLISSRIAVISDKPEDLTVQLGQELSWVSIILSADIDIELLSASLRLAELGYRLTPTIGSVVRDTSPRPHGEEGNGSWQSVRWHPLLENCTPRQCEVVEHLMLGLANKQIARKMQISESTVKAHIRVIMELLNVSNRTQVVSKLAHLKN